MPPFLFSFVAGPALTFFFRSFRVTCGTLSDAMRSGYCVDDIL